MFLGGIFIAVIALSIITFLITTFTVPQLLRTRLAGTTTTTHQSREQGPSDFPKFVGRDGREVLSELNAEYPQYQIEIVGPDYVSTTPQRYDENRVKMYVNRMGKVLRLSIG